MTYEELFNRNYGVFDPEEQEALRRASVLIVGCGGIGGAMAVLLARSGIGGFTLVEPDVYEPSNMNRQMSCFSDRLGQNKAEATREDILRINPEARVNVVTELLDPARVGELIAGQDIVVPAADDFAFSVLVFREAKRRNKPAILALPVGAMGWASVFLPSGPGLDDLQGLPKLPTHEELNAVVTARKFMCTRYYYITQGEWRVRWFRRFMDGEVPLAQICSIVWLTSCIAALEVIKVVTGRWTPVVAPRYWCIRPNRIRIQRFNPFTPRQRRFWWWMMNSTPFGNWMHRQAWRFWDWFFDWQEARQDRRRRQHAERGLPTVGQASGGGSAATSTVGTAAFAAVPGAFAVIAAARRMASKRCVKHAKRE